jgi:Zn finger protein HypA/HybF involved in hydrogenase expression
MKGGFIVYIREKLIKFLKIKNAISSVIGIFEIAISTATMISLISYYWGDWETVITAKATPSSVSGFIIGIILFICAFISKKMICDAYFYSSYFEGDLDGNIQFSDLTSITGKNIHLIKIQLLFFRIIYMKNYKLKTINGVKQIELYSKKCTCECRKCGAVIEKSVYFTGKCPYCKSSDLFAKVLTGNRFYSITNQMPGEKKSPEFYSSKHLRIRKALFTGGLCSGLIIFFIASMGCIEQIVNYNDQEYLADILLSGTSYSSYALIKSEIVDNIIWLIVLVLSMIPLICAMGLKLKYIFITESCSKFFSNYKTPFVKATRLPVLKNKKHGIKSVKGAICQHYLLNCSFEKHDDVLKVALARKIVKDECPTCGASIVGAVDENYKCKYCGNMIMDVIRKK